MMKNSLWRILHSPYPLPQSLKAHYKQGLLIGALIAIALYAFRPFGLSNMNSEVWIIGLSLLFGLITVVAVSLNWLILPPIFRSFFREEKWTVRHEIIYILWNFFTVGCFNYGTMVALGNDFNLKSFIAMQGATLVVGAFPVGLSVILEHNKLLRRALREAGQLESLQTDHQRRHAADQKAEQTIRLEGMNQNEFIEVAPNQLICLRADGNYVEVFASPDHTERPAVLRATLSKMEEQLGAYPSLQRYHRGFMANLEKVDRYDGNAQGLKLQFQEMTMSVPVSRSYISAVRDYLQS